MTWIKCTDELPSPLDECLLYFPNAIAFNVTWYCKYDEDGSRLWKASNLTGSRKVLNPPTAYCPTHYCIIVPPTNGATQ